MKSSTALELYHRVPNGLSFGCGVLDNFVGRIPSRGVKL